MRQFPMAVLVNVQGGVQVHVQVNVNAGGWISCPGSGYDRQSCTRYPVEKRRCDLSTHHRSAGRVDHRRGCTRNPSRNADGSCRPISAPRDELVSRISRRPTRLYAEPQRNTDVTCRPIIAPRDELVSRISRRPTTSRGTRSRNANVTLSTNHPSGGP